MKKLLLTSLVLISFMFLVACDENKSVENISIVQDSVSESAKFEVDMNIQVDVDLMDMSSTMIYSEVFNMMSNPNDYIGKTVRMSGKYLFYEDTDTGRKYLACVIEDATACCSQGLEFTLKDEYVYPDNYPEPNSYVTVIGKFSTYEENGLIYCHLVDADINL